MPPEPHSARDVELIGYQDLAGRPGFKLALDRDGDRWLLYIAHMFHSGWSVVDVTDPEDPTLLSFLPGPEDTITKQIQVADGLMLTAFERGESEGSGKAGVALWDLEDPADPALRSEYLIGGRGTHRNFYTGGQYAYLCACPTEQHAVESGPQKNYSLQILDVSNPDAPTHAGEWRLPEQNPETGSPPEATYFHGPAYVEGDRAYLSYGRAGMVTLDVREPTDPELVNRLQFGPSLGSFIGTHSVIPVPGTDLVAVNSEALSETSPLHRDGDPLHYAYLVDVSDERSPGFTGRCHHGPRVVSALPTPVPEPEEPYGTYYDKPGWFGPHNQHHPRDEPTRLVTSKYLFFAYFNAGLRIFDISKPLAPEEVAHWVPRTPESPSGTARSSGSQFEDVLVDSRGIVYCTDPQRGLYVLRAEMN